MSIQKAAKLAPIGVGSKATPADHLAYLFDGPSLGSLKAPPALSGSTKAYAARETRLGQIAQQDSSGQGDSPQEPKEDGNPFKKTIDDLYNNLVEEVTERVHKDLSTADQAKTRDVLDENKSNESLIRSSMRYSKWQQRAKYIQANVRDFATSQSVLAGLILHDVGGWDAVASARRFSGREILIIDRFQSQMTRKSSLAGDGRIYLTVIAVGGTSPYPNVNTYLTACRGVMGRTLTGSERAQLVEKGQLYSLGL
jgi:hypothetical protein